MKSTHRSDWRSLPTSVRKVRRSWRLSVRRQRRKVCISLAAAWLDKERPLWMVWSKFMLTQTSVVFELVVSSPFAVFMHHRDSIVEFSNHVNGTSSKDIMDLLVLTQYFDTISVSYSSVFPRLSTRLVCNLAVLICRKWPMPTPRSCFWATTTSKTSATTFWKLKRDQFKSISFFLLLSVFCLLLYPPCECSLIGCLFPEFWFCNFYVKNKASL